MNQLHPALICGLACRFALARPEVQQEIVDQLGQHPRNHAWFARFLTTGKVKAWEDYLQLTKYI